MQLINKSTYIAKSRGSDPNIDFDKKIKPIIKEVEQVDIKPQLGEAFYNKLLKYVDSHETSIPALDTLLSGGEYTYEGETYSFAGLESAIAYYTNAELMDSQSGFLAVGGFRATPDTYGSMADYKDRRNNYDKIRSVAESYMKDCLVYLNRFATETGFSVCATKKRKNKFYVIES